MKLELTSSSSRPVFPLQTRTESESPRSSSRRRKTRPKFSRTRSRSSRTFRRSNETLLPPKRRAPSTTTRLSRSSRRPTSVTSSTRLSTTRLWLGLRLERRSLRFVLPSLSLSSLFLVSFDPQLTHAPSPSLLSRRSTKPKPLDKPNSFRISPRRSNSFVKPSRSTTELGRRRSGASRGSRYLPTISSPPTYSPLRTLIPLSRYDSLVRFLCSTLPPRLASLPYVDFFSLLSMLPGVVWIGLVSLSLLATSVNAMLVVSSVSRREMDASSTRRRVSFLDCFAHEGDSERKVRTLL